MKYPIGIQTFEKIREDGYVYVDKTDMIYSLAQEGKIYFLSRPRRFGKSLLISTLENYFLGRKDLFEGLKIDALEKEWIEYPLFHIDFNDSDFTEDGVLEEVIDSYLSKWEAAYGIKKEYDSLGFRFCNILAEAHRQTGRRAVVLVDEYDKPILDLLDHNIEIVFQGNRMTLEEHNKNILNGFYSTFKAADSDLHFVFVTGVTMHSPVSMFNGFNQPEDISLSRRYETLCGITQKELEHYFSEPIRSMAEVYKCSIEEMKIRLAKQYGGYHFSDNPTSVYNPFSLLNALSNRRIQAYWFKTDMPTYLIRPLSRFKENQNKLTGRYYAPRAFDDYMADIERPLPIIYQSGFLTIKNYDRDLKTDLLDFPNNEVKECLMSLETLIKNNLKQD